MKTNILRFVGTVQELRDFLKEEYLQNKVEVLVDNGQQHYEDMQSQYER